MSLLLRLTLANTTLILLRSIDANMLEYLATHFVLASATARNFAMSLRVSGFPASYPFRGSLDFHEFFGAALCRPGREQSIATYCFDVAFEMRTCFRRSVRADQAKVALSYMQRVRLTDRVTFRLSLAFMRALTHRSIEHGLFTR